jgi:ADP-ribose pyrophosphatase YjhB (NUDIX family)
MFRNPFRRRSPVHHPEPTKWSPPAMIVRAKEPLSGRAMRAMKEHVRDGLYVDRVLVVDSECDVFQMLDGRWVNVFAPPPEPKPEADDEEGKAEG